MQKDPIISLGPHFEQFVAQQIAEGRFGSTSEVVRAGLRILEEKETRLQALRQALKEGEDSGHSDYSLENGAVGGN